MALDTMPNNLDWYPKRTFGALPRDIAARFPKREGLVFEDQRFSFAEIDREIDRAARALIAHGVERGDHVSLWLNNCAEWTFLMFALARVGAVQVPINTRFRTIDLDYVLRQSDSRFLITHDRSGPIDYLSMVREVVSMPNVETSVQDSSHRVEDSSQTVDDSSHRVEDSSYRVEDSSHTVEDSSHTVEDSSFPELRGVFVLSDAVHAGTIRWADALRDGASVDDSRLRERAASVDPDDPVVIMYTSGTTGFPKGVVHNHRIIRNVEERGSRMGIGIKDVILNYLPLFHAFGYSEGALMSMVFGAKQVLTEFFDSEESMDLVEREGVSLMHGFETHLQGLCEAQAARPRKISTLRAGIFAGGTHSSLPIMRRGAEMLAPMRAITAYGMTELWVGASLGSLDDDVEQCSETSGYPAIGYDIRIVDPETGIEQPFGSIGEIQVRGFGLMLGYYKKPDETAAAWTEDDWFRTGDQGLIREDGCLRFLGRYKDMLKVGGENVDPMEIEGLLLEHVDVRQVAVIGLPDARLTEVPVAFVVATKSDLTSDEVISYCRGKLASFKIPKYVLFTEELPMTASGKVRKVELREDARSRLAQLAGH